MLIIKKSPNVKKVWYKKYIRGRMSISEPPELNVEFIEAK